LELRREITPKDSGKALGKAPENGYLRIAEFFLKSRTGILAKSLIGAFESAALHCQLPIDTLFLHQRTDISSCDAGLTLQYAADSDQKSISRML